MFNIFLKGNFKLNSLFIKIDRKINEKYFYRKSPEILPMLNYTVKKGNTTVYEWRTGSVPKKIEKNPNVSYAFGDDETEENSKNEDKIDFDVADLTNMGSQADQVFK